MTRARELAIDAEREEVAAEVRDLVARSGLPKQDFAENRDLAVPLADLYVREGRALGNLDRPDATGSRGHVVLTVSEGEARLTSVGPHTSGG